MDAFFASIEQRDHSQYRHRPIAVGGEGPRGVVAAASYEARKYGVFSAMPSRTARQKCLDIIFVAPRFDVYKSVSSEIMQIFREYTDLVEPLSLDEAYLDVTINKRGMRSATLIAKEIKSRIKALTRLTASAGISINKFLAKVASGMNKPDGLTVIPPKDVEQFIRQLPIDKFFGVGKVTGAKMKALGIKTGADLLKYEQIDLIRHFGKAGTYFYNVSRGFDDREVKPERIRKSFGAERTFEEDIIQYKMLHDKLKSIAEELGHRLEKYGISGKTVTLKVKYHDFELKTRCAGFSSHKSSSEEIYTITKNLLHSSDLPRKPIRLLGISLSNLNTAENADRNTQLTLEF
ncbi:DNA polymerase IV [bacterium]|nr:DNA polymerase IV [bacterium]